MNLTETLKTLLRSKPTRPAQTGATFDFVKSRKSILRELIISKESGNIMGIYCAALGDGMFLAGIEEVESNTKSETIVLSQYDASGQILTRTRIGLDEIQMVVPFNSLYRNPVVSPH